MIAINMGLMDAAANLPSGGFTVDQLATATSADPLFVCKCRGPPGAFFFFFLKVFLSFLKPYDLSARLMRLLAGIGVFKEVSPGLFTPTPLAEAYVTGSPFREAFMHLYVERAATDLSTRPAT
jgi:hypothetical protein